MRHFQLRQCSVGEFPVSWIDRVVREDPYAAEKSRQHDVASARVPGAGEHQVIRDDAEKRTQLKHVPALLPQDRHRRTFLRHRITLACNRFD